MRCDAEQKPQKPYNYEDSKHSIFFSINIILFSIFKLVDTGNLPVPLT